MTILIDLNCHHTCMRLGLRKQTTYYDSNFTVWETRDSITSKLQYMNVPRKTDHFAILEILVLRCSMCFALHNGDNRFTIAYTVSRLRESNYKLPRNDFLQKWG